MGGIPLGCDRHSANHLSIRRPHARPTHAALLLLVSWSLSADLTHVPSMKPPPCRLPCAHPELVRSRPCSTATVNSGGASGDADAIPWGEGRLFDRAASSAVVVLDEPGDSDLLYVGPLVLLTSLTTLGGLLWPQLVVQMMS